MERFEFKKQFGQNFLKNEELLTQIVENSGVMSDEVVVEIGSGMGSLTSVLASRAKKVYSFEIDKDLFDGLQKKFDGTNVCLVFKDIMKVSDEELNEIVGGKFRLVANLPYYITSPIITRFLQNKNLISLTVMVQEEVADRIVAKPKSKDYGVLTIICNLFGLPQKIMRVGREMFYPIPKVDSAVVKIDKVENDGEFKDFIEFVKKAFSMRRKKLSANLVSQKLKKQDVEKILYDCGFNPLARAEELSVSDFLKIYGAICDKNK